MSNLDIIKIREELKVTQKEFAELIGVDRRTVINYEQGKIIPESKKKLLELLLQGKRDQSESSVKNHPENCKEQLENKDGEILELKDHIKTLKEFIAEKTTVADFYKSENIRLKEEIEMLKKD